MQAYGKSFAQIYNHHWISFVRQVAPRLMMFYSSTEPGRDKQAVLDLCCGTGQLAAHFLSMGFPVLGLDLSPYMLAHAKENCQTYLESGQGQFILADATNFQLDRQIGLVVSTFDSLNHLPDMAALKSCFASVYPVLADNGIFIFDLNTPLGLSQWNGVHLQDNDDIFLLNRNFYEEGLKRSYMAVTGFLRGEDGKYERFSETAYNTIFDLAEVRAALLAAGWQEVYYARPESLRTPIDNPDELGRVFFVAYK